MHAKLGLFDGQRKGRQELPANCAPQQRVVRVEAIAHKGRLVGREASARQYVDGLVKPLRFWLEVLATALTQNLNAPDLPRARLPTYFTTSACLMPSSRALLQLLLGTSS